MTRLINIKYKDDVHSVAGSSEDVFTHYLSNKWSESYKKGGKVYGKGVNNADYMIGYRNSSGKIIKCPIYMLWKGMLDRCYNYKNTSGKSPTYKKHEICQEWFLFLNFREFVMDKNKEWRENFSSDIWQRRHMDKDLKSLDSIFNKGSLTYSPCSVIFIEPCINTFLIGCDASRGEHPIGVNWHKATGKYIAQIHNPFIKKKEHLGSFACPEEAHQAWLKRKTELAHQYADRLDESLYSGDREAAFHLRRLFPKINP
jgi:hypothetical protein